jgi:hypothetical protein
MQIVRFDEGRFMRRLEAGPSGGIGADNSASLGASFFPQGVKE